MRAIDFITENIAGRNKGRVYKLMIDTIGSGPFDGGCVVMAQAIQARHGGNIVVLTGPSQHNTKPVAQHAAVQLGDILIDFDGPASVQDFVKRFERNELANSGGKITGIRPMQNHDLPDAPRSPDLVDKLSRLIR